MTTDERVQVAIANWRPRFIANGVDLNDFKRITEQVEHWNDWCRRWSECGAMHAKMGEQAEADACYESAAQHYFQAAITYHFGKYVFVHRPDELRAAHEHVVELYRRALPYFDVPGERVAIPYEGGETLYGVLRKPRRTLEGWAKPPVVILIPGLDSVKEELHNYGDDFLRRGMAVLAIDGPGQGEMEFQYPLRADYEVPIRFVIDYLERREDVDASRVGLMGVSLGGYFAPRAAAFEPRVKAVVSVSGAYDLAEEFASCPVLTRDTFIYRLKAADKAEALKLLEPFNLRGVVAKIQVPLLVIAGRLDRVLPPEAGERMAAEAPGRAELWMFEDGNHVCNNIPYKYRPQQADWMRQKLLQW